MSELSHPLAAKRIRRPRQRRAGAPSFSELVSAHYTWSQERENGSANGKEATSDYQHALTSYQRRHGEVVSAYWCSSVKSAAALTEKKRAISWLTPVSNFHRESDWATQHAPDIARQLHRCDELAVRARIVLKGVRQRICLRLVMASAAHLLSLVDARAGQADEQKLEAALEQERRSLDDAEAYYREAANGQAQIVYFTGMVTVAAVVSIVAGFFLAIDDWAGGVAALSAGAAGAVVSVVQRINAGQFELEYDVGRPYAFFLGGLRPLIGGAFAVVIAFAFTSGIMHLPIASSDPETNRHAALLVICFLAGFSERWAQDTLATALPVGGGHGDTKK